MTHDRLAIEMSDFSGTLVNFLKFRRDAAAGMTGTPSHADLILFM